MKYQSLAHKFANFNQTVYAMLIGGFLVKMTYFMSWPFLIVILNGKLAVSPLSVGFILGVSSGLSALLGLYIGYLSDKFGRKPLMITGCFIMGLSFFGLIFSHTFWHFFSVMALMGIGMTMLETSTKAVISDSLSHHTDREFALNLRYFLINLAGAFGALFGLWIGLKNPNALFIGTALTYIGYLIWIFLLINPINTNNEAQTLNLIKTIGVIKGDRIFLWLITANFFILIVYSQFNASLPQIITLSLAEKAAQLIVLLNVINCATVVIFQFPLLKLLEKFSVSRRSQIGLLLMLMAQIFFIIIDKHSMWAWGLVFFILSIGEAILFPTINVHIDQMAKPELRGSYFGAGTLSGFGSSAGPIIGGFVLGVWNDTAYFTLTTVLCFLCILIYQKIGYKNPSQNS